MIQQHRISLMVLIFFLQACGTATPTSTPVPLPTFTLTSRPTNTPTTTPVSTATIQPSATPTPTATPTPLVANLGQVIFSENFDNLDFPFNVYGPAWIEGGVLVLEREKGYQPPPNMWPFGGIYGTLPVQPGITTIVLFKTIRGTTFNIGYHTGVYGTESLRRFSFNSGLEQSQWDLYKGKFPIKSWSVRQSNFETWHYFSITRSTNGDIDAKIWERDKPKTMLKFHGNLGPEWGTLELTFFIDYHLGSFMLDEYQDLK
jgi:hypothetical protein